MWKVAERLREVDDAHPNILKPDGRTQGDWLTEVADGVQVGGRKVIPQEKHLAQPPKRMWGPQEVEQMWHSIAMIGVLLAPLQIKM